MILGPDGQPISSGRTIELDPRQDRGVTITAPRNEATWFRLDGTADALVFPAGTQWHVLPERVYQQLLVSNQRLASTLRDRGEDAEDSGVAIAAEIMGAGMARNANGLD